MVRAISFIQDPPECAEEILKLISDLLNCSIEVCNRIEDLPETSSGCKLLILILPSVPGVWKSLIEDLHKRFPTTQILVLLNPEYRVYINILLDTAVDDVIIPHIAREKVIDKLSQFNASQNRLEFPKSNDELLGKLNRNQFIGRSETFLESIKKIPAIGKLDSPVLILGESGTGKELCARAIHYLGSRSDKPFIPINCAAIPDNLFENELFGHARGAYTDAGRSQPGIIQEANGGTLFLDEVNSLSIQAQSKLLRFLEDGRVRPLGSTQYIDMNVRVICATNVNLTSEVERGTFREDLYYRINVLTLELPPLRERFGDVEVLSDFFLDKYSRRYNRGEMYFSGEVREMLLQYEWPGNVRELSNNIERAVCMTSSNILHLRDMPLKNATAHSNETLQGFREEKISAIEMFEEKYLRQILRDHHGNISQAARSAKTNRRLFQRLMRKYQIASATSA
jgi:two-component system response regulator GlrR